MLPKPQKDAEINRLVDICKQQGEQLEELEHNRAWCFEELECTRGKVAALQKHIYDLEAKIAAQNVDCRYVKTQQFDQWSKLLHQTQAEVHRRGWDISDKDLELVMDQSGASREVAIATVNRHNGDLVNAIMELAP